MVRRLSIGKNNHLTCYSLAINPRNEYQQQMFSYRNTKNLSWIPLLPGAMWCVILGQLFQMLYLTLTTLLANSADDKLACFSYFSQKTGFDISCRLSPICMKCQILFSEEKQMGTICMKCQILFSEKKWGHLHEM